jgi:mevalonate pyrophosphate decarboxylase
VGATDSAEAAATSSKMKQKAERTIMATKKSPAAGKNKVEKVLHEFKEGELKSGNGKKVTDRKQAVAIGLSEARHAGAKIPKK